MDAINILNNNGTYYVGFDMEDGIYPGPYGDHLSIGSTPFATVAGWNDGNTNYEVYVGDATSGKLSLYPVTPLPSGYSPMRQEGGIVLGVGGDNSGALNSSGQGDGGEFFEGAMTSGIPSDQAFKDVQADVVLVGYATR